MGSTGFGLLVEEHRGEISAAWKQAVEVELGVKEAVLSFAVAPLLREMALTLGREPDPARSREAWTRCAVLVRSTGTSAQLAREFMILQRCTWDALRARGATISPAERRAVDQWLHEALAESLDRLERVRLRAAAYSAPGVVPPSHRPAPVRPVVAAKPAIVPARRTPVPPISGSRPAAMRPPPLPSQRVAAARAQQTVILELDPIEG